jgi:biofilm protein TabA
MIYDSLDNFRLYQEMHPLFKDVAAFLGSGSLGGLSLGRHALDQTGAQVVISTYQTHEIAESFIECHQKFIDIQILLQGTERLGFCPRNLCAPLSPYDQEKDFQKLNGHPDFIILRPGYFALLLPQDAHMPGIGCAAKKESIKKAVIKVPVL